MIAAHSSDSPVPAPATVSFLSVETLVPLLTYYDRTAVAAQTRWRRFFVRSLVALGVITGLETLHGLVPSLQRAGLKAPVDLWLEVLALVAGTVGIGYELLHHHQHHRGFGAWTRVRARAEALRSEIWRYLFDVSARPHAAHYTDGEWRAFAEGLEPAGTTLPADPFSEALLARKAALRALPVADRLAAYAHERLGGQRAYFARKAAVLHRRATRLRYLINALLVAAVGWNVLRIYATIQHKLHAPGAGHGGSLLTELNLFITLIALVGLLKAWREAEGTDRLAATYQQMSARLNQLLAARPAATATTADLRLFIDDCETALSAQNQEWGAKRG